jgi:hypothetical protein
MTPLLSTRHHATTFVPSDIARPIDAIRRTWDPVMAAQIAAHVTLVHPRTSARGPQLWAQERERSLHEIFEVSELALTGFDGARWQVMTTFALANGE